MYNKYIGNTGKFVRVEDHPISTTNNSQRPEMKPPPPHEQPQDSIQPHSKPGNTASAGNKNKPSLLGGLGGGLNGLLGGLGGGLKGLGGLGGLSDGFRGIFDHLPFGLDIGDILLFLLLFFFFIESGDEEFIIILAVIAYSMFKDR